MELESFTIPQPLLHGSSTQRRPPIFGADKSLAQFSRWSIISTFDFRAIKRIWWAAVRDRLQLGRCKRNHLTSLKRKRLVNRRLNDWRRGRGYKYQYTD